MTATRGAVLITGGFGGLGTAMARTLLDAGHTVIVADRRIDDGAVWREQFDVGDDQLSTVGLDVTREEDVQRLAGELRAAGRHVAYVVNNAGVQGAADITSFDSRRFDIVMRVNLYGTFYVTKAFSGPMVERGFGRIVNISSVNAYDFARNQAAYAAAKAGILGFTRSVALDLARHGITVNAIAPGVIWHDGLAQVFGENARDRLVGDTPVGRAGEPRHIAAAVAYLLSDDAEYHTGQVVHVNGGMYLGG